VSTYLKKQALKFIASIDHNHREAARIDWHASEAELIQQAAAATRKSILRLPISDIHGNNIPLRIALKNESPQQLIDRCLDGRWRSVGRDFYFPDGLDYTLSPDPALNTLGLDFGEWIWQVNRHTEWSIAARLYHYDAQPKYAQAVSTWLRNWLEQCPMPREDLNAQQGPWRTIEIGIRMGSQWPSVLSSLVDAPEIDDILFLAWMQCYAEQSGFVWKYRKTNNWLLMELNGMTHAGVQINIHQDAAKWRELSTNEFIRQVDVQFHPDGFQWELSTSYHAVCLHNYHRTVKALRLGGWDVPLKLEELLKTMLKPFRALARPNGNCFNFQDSHNCKMNNILKDFPESWYDQGDRFFLSGSGKPPKTKCHIMENAGYAVLRSGYAQNDTVIAFDGGPLGAAHQHEDKLSIQICSGDDTLIGEAGLVDYADTPERRYSKTTLGHSTALVDGLGQNRLAEYTAEKTKNNDLAGLEYDVECSAPWVRAHYDEGYGTPDNRCVVHTRKVILLSKNHIQVCDEFEPTDNQTHKIEILYHCIKDYAVLEGDIFQTKGEGSNFKLNWWCDGEAVKANMIKGGKDPDLRGWAAPENYTLGYWMVVEKPCLTLSLECSKKMAVVVDIHIEN